MIFAAAEGTYQYKIEHMFDWNMGLPKYYAFASHRKDVIKYAHTKDEIIAKYGPKMCMMGRYPIHMALAMGDEYYYAKFTGYDEGVAFDEFVRERAK